MLWGSDIPLSAWLWFFAKVIGGVLLFVLVCYLLALLLCVLKDMIMVAALKFFARKNTEEQKQDQWDRP